MWIILKDALKGALIAPISALIIIALVSGFLTVLFQGVTGLLVGLIAVFYYGLGILLVFVPTGAVIGGFVGVYELWRTRNLVHRRSYNRNDVKVVLLLMLTVEIVAGIGLAISGFFQR